MQHDRNELVENLTLALLYLTSWREYKTPLATMRELPKRSFEPSSN